MAGSVTNYALQYVNSMSLLKPISHMVDPITPMKLGRPSSFRVGYVVEDDSGKATDEFIYEQGRLNQALSQLDNIAGDWTILRLQLDPVVSPEPKLERIHDPVIAEHWPRFEREAMAFSALVGGLRLANSRFHNLPSVIKISKRKTPEIARVEENLRESVRELDQFLAVRSGLAMIAMETEDPVAVYFGLDRDLIIGALQIDDSLLE